VKQHNSNAGYTYDSGDWPRCRDSYTQQEHVKGKWEEKQFKQRLQEPDPPFEYPAHQLRTRAHHDAQLIGASTLREELGADGKSLDYGIDDEELRAYRLDILKLGLQKVIVLTGSGNLDLGASLFNSARVEPWIITSAEGEKNIRAQIKTPAQNNTVKIISVGAGGRIDVAAAVQLLRREHGIRTLLCEGGPNLYSELLKNQFIDEDFRTIAFQVLGKSTIPGIERPTTYGDVSYMPETAPWFRLISMHVALPYHAFLRLRYEGPRKFSA